MAEVGFSKVLYRKEGGVAWITLNNPAKYNALELDLRRELKAALMDAAGDSAVRAVVIRGAGGNFSAGADIKPSSNGTRPRQLEWLTRSEPRWFCLRSSETCRSR